MPSISLAKALKVKNRLVNRLQKTSDEISGNNCKIEGQEVFDIESRFILRGILIDSVVEIKTAIYRGNIDIQETLYKLSELKSSISLLQVLDTRNESSPHGYQNTPIVYKSYLKKQECLETIKKIESVIDQLQEKIDEYNYTTKIEVSKTILDLAS